MREKARAVKDGNVITAGGFASGIDFGLNPIAEIAGETAARTMQRGVEYDPSPPFDTGHPDRASAAIASSLIPGHNRELGSANRAGLEQAIQA